jgi:hypothetical protein
MVLVDESSALCFIVIKIHTSIIPKNVVITPCRYRIPTLIIPYLFSGSTASVCVSCATSVTIGIVQQEAAHSKVTFFAEMEGTPERCRGID